MKTTTIKDIAAKLDLHHSTVSRALRDHPDISAETKQLVIEAADMLDYRPNPVAQHLRGQRRVSLAVEIPDLAIPACREFVSAIAGRCTDQEIPLQLIVQAEKDQTRTQKLAIAAGIHGLIEWRECIAEDSLSVRGCKMLHVGGRTTVQPLGFPSVSCSWRVCTAKLVNHLIGRGLRRIGIITGPNDQRSEAIHDTYKNVLLDAYVPVLSRHCLTGATTRRDGILAAEHMLSQPERPEIVVISEEVVAAGFLSRRDDHAPMVALIGGSSSLPGLACSSLLPWPEIAMRGLEMILEMISGKSSGSPLDISPHLRVAQAIE